MEASGRDKRIRLLAMAPSGETLMARQGTQVWLIQPPGSAGPALVDEETVGRAVAYHGFERVDRDFDSWDDLDDFRQQRAAALPPGTLVDRASMDLHDVRRMLGVATRWQSQNRSDQARRLALELLRVPVVRGDEALHDELVAFLERLDRPAEPPRPQPRNARQAAARERWRAVMPERAA